jgi:predicted SprT family Zn-dependent metalloprotease
MPLLRQLEFAFRSTGILPVGQPGVSPGELVIEQEGSPKRVHPVPGKMPAGPTAGTAVLLQTARELLRAHGADRIARELRVEWNSRLKTAAGRADYCQKLISLNPQLFEHPTEIDRTLRHELAHILAQFRAGCRRALPHGAEWRQACCDLGIAEEKRCTIFLSKSAKALGGTCTNVRSASAIFPGSVGLCALSHVLPVAARITAENSTRGFD